MGSNSTVQVSGSIASQLHHLRGALRPVVVAAKDSLRASTLWGVDNRCDLAGTNSTLWGRSGNFDSIHMGPESTLWGRSEWEMSLRDFSLAVAAAAARESATTLVGRGVRE